MQRNKTTNNRTWKPAQSSRGLLFSKRFNTFNQETSVVKLFLQSSANKSYLLNCVSSTVWNVVKLVELSALVVICIKIQQLVPNRTATLTTHQLTWRTHIWITNSALNITLFRLLYTLAFQSDWLKLKIQWFSTDTFAYILQSGSLTGIAVYI